MQLVLNSFQYENSQAPLGDFVDVTVMCNNAVKIQDVVLIKGLTCTDHSRFGKDLVDSIIITKWAIKRNLIPAIAAKDDLANDVTRSTRFTLPPTKANETLVADFAQKMEVEYGVDIEQDKKDKNTFFVLAPNDKDESVGPYEKQQEQKTRKPKDGVSPVTRLLTENGFVCQNSNMKDKILCFQLHYLPKTKTPKNLGFIYGTEAEKKEKAEEALKLLLANHYNVVLSKKGSVIKFKHSDLPKINAVAKLAGIKSWSKTNVTTGICYTRSSVKNGLQPVSIIGKGTHDDKLVAKNKFIEALKKAGYEVVNPKINGTLAFYVKIAEEAVAKPETPIVDSEQSLEVTPIERKKVTQPAVASSSFAETITNAFLQELESNLELRKKVIEKLKIETDRTKILTENFISSLHSTNKAFEIPGLGKCLSVTEVEALFSKVLKMS